MPVADAEREWSWLDDLAGSLDQDFVVAALDRPTALDSDPVF